MTEKIRTYSTAFKAVRYTLLITDNQKVFRITRMRKTSNIKPSNYYSWTSRSIVISIFIAISVSY